MTFSDKCKDRVHEYYNGMHLDGFAPWEILQAAHKTMLKEIENRDSVDLISIKSEVKIKR